MKEKPTRLIPTLTNVACPGEKLRAANLWLPKNTPAPQQASERPDWKRRLPPALKDRAESMLQTVRTQVMDVADAELDNPLPSPDPAQKKRHRNQRKRQQRKKNR